MPGRADGLRARPSAAAAVAFAWASPQTAEVDAFVARLRARTTLPVYLQDERLSSVEAEARLAVRETDWRRRKARLDAAAAAVILQEFLDASPVTTTAAVREPRA